MKRFITILTILLMGTMLFAQIEIDIPFNQNIIGDSFVDTGAYSFTSDFFYITNLGETEEFTISIRNDNVPEGWIITWCHDLAGSGGCHGPESTWNFEFPADSLLALDFTVNVASTDSAAFHFEISAPSLNQPEIIPFSFKTSDCVAVNEDNESIPEISINQNYPNPFNKSTDNNTIISYNLKNNQVSGTSLVIYDIKGKVVRKFNHLNHDNQKVKWNGKTDTGNPVSNGIYFYKLKGNTNSPVKKMILIK